MEDQPEQRQENEKNYIGGGWTRGWVIGGWQLVDFKPEVRD